MYCFTSSVNDRLLSRIRYAKTQKEAWTNLKKVIAAITARKLQLRLELNNVQQKDMSVANYTTRIKEIYDSFASNNVTIEEDEMVQVCLGDLASKFGVFRTTICTREKTPSFFELQTMLLVEENHAGASTSTYAENKMLYKEEDRSHGRGRRGESARYGGRQQEQNRRHGGDADYSSRPSRSGGSQDGARNLLS
mgnify:CR=1 FL=1